MTKLALAIAAAQDPLLDELVRQERANAALKEQIERCLAELVQAVAVQARLLERIEHNEREIAALRRELDDRPPPEVGPPGPPGPQGEAGAAGLGIDAPPWESRVYREGAIVQHYHGQYFQAVQDTAHEPGDSPEWKRIGFAGIRWRGELVEGMELHPGDHYRENNSLFLVDHTRTPRLLNHRGERGPRGKEGPPGKAGVPEIEVIIGTDSLTLKIDGREFEIDLRPIVEAMLAEHVLREILPTIRQIGERLVALERGRL
jgi:hypothetical protein